ncbi:DUF4450 domain-containing protein [uncultured Bacteroides sp.]|uniref:DUF4450 domain-containing protein n=1 Tax=uncultured Bacteroides sp. TaxID=162156 RepID=UPI002AA7C82C|nr:DUF4450 domain-containing protein [uncultured Bacteroides sp.]
MSKFKGFVILCFWLTIAQTGSAGNNKTFNRVVGTAQKESRILACNYPEFSFHLPQLAGNFRLGIQCGERSSWSEALKSVSVKEKNGNLTYVIRDALLGNGILTVRVVGLTYSAGLIMEVEAKDVPPTLQLIWSFGGCYGKVLNDKTDSRMKPIYCKDNVFSVEGTAFICYYGESMKLKVIRGVTPPASDIRLSDAHRQDTPLLLYQSGKKTDAPVLAAACAIKSNEKLYFCFYTQNKEADYNYYMLPALFTREFNKE